MKEPEIDPERLGALLAGRLGERERTELLARLAASDEEYELFADTAAVLREMEEEEAGAAAPDTAELPAVPRLDAGPPPSSSAPAAGSPATPAEDGVIPLRPRARPPVWRRPGAHWGAIAAVLALLALVPVLRPRGAAPDPGRPAELLASPGKGLPAGWVDRTLPWGSTRGDGDALTDERRAARAGVVHAQLVVAVAARDSAAVSLLTKKMKVLLEGAKAAGTVTEKYLKVGARAGASPEELEAPLREAGRGAARLLGAERMSLAAWTETALVAVERRDAAFFAAPGSRSALDRAADLPWLPDSGRVAVKRVRSAAAGGQVRDWDALREALNELLKALG